MEYRIDNIILDDLLLDIKEGRYKEFDKLPSSNVMASKYNVSRIKVRGVYERLASMGYIDSYQGRGYYLKKKKEVIELTLGGESFTEKIESQGYNLETKIIFCERIPYNERIYNKLNLSKHEEVYKLGRLRIINEESIAIHISYIPKKNFPSIYEESKSIKSINKYYKEKGYRNIVSKETVLSSIYPTNKERMYLECGDLVPVIKIENLSVDEEKNKIIDYTEILYRGDRFKYKI